MTDFTKPSAPPYTRSTTGQDTGGDEARHKQEAGQIFKMFADINLDIDDPSIPLDPWERGFLRRIQGDEYFSGREIFKLREIKDKLVEKGIL